MPSTITVILAGDSAPLTAALAEGSAGFMDMAATAEGASADIVAALSDLASAIDGLSAEVDVLAASFDSLSGSAGTASAAVESAGASADTATAEVMTLGDAIDTLSAAVDGLMGSITPLLATIGTLIAVMGAMTIINDVSSWIENLISQMFQLDEQTQRVVNSWQYLFAQAPGGGKLASQNLASWAYQESPKLPFTAVDLRSGISTLGTIPGISPEEIEKFMPILADIASTLGASDFGGQGINLQQAAQAIVGAQFGLTRQLRYELHINPQELLKYGLVGKATATGLRITDPSTLLPAIEKWAAARGLGGAATEQETTTFWGAMSSFQDYVQNFLQTTGGIDPATGQVRKGSMFGGLQDILININKALAGAQASGGKGPLGELMGSVGSILGGGVQSGESLFGGLVSGFGGAGGTSMVKDFLAAIKDFGDWLRSSAVQEEIKKLGEGIGQFAEQVAKLAGDALPVMMKGLGMLVQSLEMLWNSLSPSQRQALEGFVGDIFLVIGSITGLIATLIAAAAKFNEFTNHVSGLLGTWAKDLAGQFKQWGANFIQMLMDGIESMLGNFGGLLNKVGGEIKNKLGFNSPPKEGPLSDSDRYMPNMMMMFAEGIEHGLPGVARAAQHAAAVISGTINPIAHSMGGGGVSNTYGPTTNYGGNSSMLNVYGATGVMIEEIMLRMLQQNDRAANLKLGAPGGMYLFGMH